MASIVGKMVHRALRAPEEAAEAVFESAHHPRSGAPPSAPVFILGLPRSGTTLIYQYIVHRKHVAYFTNGVGKRVYSPCLISYLQRRRNEPYRSDFVSKYGRSDGPMAPREGGSLWLRFFDLDAYQSFADLSPRVVSRLRVLVGCVEAIFDGAPFVNKNVKHLLRIDALAKIFPDSSFLLINRDIADVALSVLRGRVQYSGGAAEWFSAKPENYKELVDLDPVDQIVGQLVALDRRLRADLALLEPSRVHEVHYDDFCARPDNVVDGVPVLARCAEKNAAVTSFEVRHNRPQNEDEERLVEGVRRAFRA